MDEALILLGLTGVSFLAATILPAQSEAAVIGLQGAGYSPLLLVIFASIGNTAGAIVNWLLGRGVTMFGDRKRFPASRRQLERASDWYHKWGKWSLLLSWAPIFGDAITVAAGILKEPFRSFILLVAIAKTGRYIVLVLVTSGLVS